MNLNKLSLLEVFISEVLSMLKEADKGRSYMQNICPFYDRYKLVYSTIYWCWCKQIFQKQNAFIVNSMSSFRRIISEFSCKITLFKANCERDYEKIKIKINM